MQEMQTAMDLLLAQILIFLIPKFTSAASGYEDSDWNLDGSITSTDFNLFNPNFISSKQSYAP